MKYRLRMVLGTVSVSGALLATTLGASPASAAPVVSNCYTGSGGNGYLCYYFDSNYNGAEEGIANADPDETVNPYVVFQYANVNGGRDGLNDCVPYPSGNLPCAVNNEVESAANFRNDCKAHMFYYANFGTPVVNMSRYPLSGYDMSSLGNLTDENRSQNFC